MSKPPYSVIFAGTPEFAVPSLNALIESDDFDVKLVISQPDKPVGRKQKILPTPVKKAALAAGTRVLQPADINAEYPTIEHDYLVVVAYGQILKEHILSAPKIIAVNLHASLLPRWRGASPMQHSLLEDDAETGITVQRMVKALDAGPILSQKALPLTGTETILHLHDTLAAMGATLLVNTLRNLPEETEQTGNVTICHKLTRAMGELDPTCMTAEEIERHVRALVPWPGVAVNIEGERIKLHIVSLIATETSVPLPCKDSVLHLVTVQPESKSPMPAIAWKHGRK